MPERKEILLDFFNEDKRKSHKRLSFVQFGYLFLIIGGIMLYLYFFCNVGNILLLGLAFLITGLFLIRKKLNNLFYFDESDNLNEETIEKKFFSDVDKTVLTRIFKIFGIQKHKITEENIFKIFVPVYSTASETETNFLRTQLDDETNIYSHWQIHVIITGKNFISYYSCSYNWLDNKLNNEISDEFYYADIASIKSEFSEEKFEISDDEISKAENTKRFIITNVSGDKIEFVSEKPALNLNEYFKTDTEELVRNIRQIIRKKRFPDDESFSEKDIDFEIEDTTNKDNNE